MKNNKQVIHAWVLSGGLLLAASSGTAAEPHDKAGDANRGAATWSQNCNRCHNMRSPTEFRDELWRAIVTHMRLRAGLTGQQQRDVLAFMQASNNPAPAMTTSLATITAVGGNEGSSGKQIYASTCVACHGSDGKGTLPGVPDFTDPSGRLSKSDEVLLQHITEGFQSPGSPMAMPARGGNPSLGSVDIVKVLAYLRERFNK